MANEDKLEADTLMDLIEEALGSENLSGIASLARKLKAGELVTLIERLNETERAIVYRVLPKTLALEVFESLAPALQGELLEELNSEEVSTIFAKLDQQLETITTCFVFFRCDGTTGNQVLGITFTTFATLDRLDVRNHFFVLTITGFTKITVAVIWILGGTARTSARSTWRTTRLLGWRRTIIRRRSGFRNIDFARRLR